MISKKGTNMKIKNLIIIALSFILIILLSLIIYSSKQIGKDNYVYNTPPQAVESDDEFSKSLKKDLGHVVTYEGKSSHNEYEIYSYIIGMGSKQYFLNLYESVNTHYDLISGKVGVVLRFSPSAGLFRPIATLYNFSDEDETTYNGFFSLYLGDVSYTYFDDPFLYTELEGICRFEIPDSLYDESIEDNINWFEVWPELEKLIVYDSKNPSEKTVYERPE